MSRRWHIGARRGGVLAEGVLRRWGSRNGLEIGHGERSWWAGRYGLGSSTLQEVGMRFLELEAVSCEVEREIGTEVGVESVHRRKWGRCQCHSRMCMRIVCVSVYLHVDIIQIHHNAPSSSICVT